MLDSDLDYASQPDWIDTAGDPLWTAPAVPASGTEAIYLLLRAGGWRGRGPRTARRGARRARHGGALAHPPACRAHAHQRHRLPGGDDRPRAALGGERPAAAEAASLCEPSGQGGYLGPQNQLIQVQVASIDNGVPTLVSGFDNASFLYRIAGPPVVDTAAGTTTVTLATAPVDSFSQPAQNQAVEVLMAAAQLTGSDYIAAATGVVSSVAVGYNADTRQLELGTALDANVLSSPLLFLRVWQGAVVYSSPGPVPLGDTGIQVAISTTASTYNVGDYWTFAVRPGTPTTVSPVYPERIQDAPQPPDGPPM